MLRCLLVRILDYLNIVGLLLSHIKKKWRLELSGFISGVFVIILGFLLPNVISLLYGESLDFTNASITYISMTIFGLIIMITMSSKSKMTFSRLLYEIRYNFRLLRFMVECYHNIIDKYRDFLRMHAEIKRTSKEKYHDLTIVGTIFFKIFKMYFETMDSKNKNSEPYLIDTQEMKNLYTSKDFNDFYSNLFFADICKDTKNSFEKVLIYILDEVLTALYKKSWFVEYYDERTVFQLVKYILTNWYDHIVKYSLIHKYNDEVFV